MNQNSLNEKLLIYVKNSTSAFHATKELKEMLLTNSFIELSEGDKWNLKEHGKYFVTRNDSALIAFKTGKMNSADVGIKMAGGHTDSPSFKVKPNSDMFEKGSFQLAVEPYGGMLLGTWFDRDLSLAGRVNYLSNDGSSKSCLIDFKRPIAIIPSLAIHMNRKANEGQVFNKQKEMPPLICQLDRDEKLTFEQMILNELKNQYQIDDLKKILSSEIFLYDTITPQIIGYKNDYIASSRIDNLFSCFLSVQALIDAKDDVPMLIVCNDHEECGSSSTSGASGTFLKDVLERIVGVGEAFSRAMFHSFMLSADNAHALHPNYAEVHDANHAPIINKGPVIKVNANQRYATNSETASHIMSICEKFEIPYQKFVARSDMGCGSTIGPITSTLLGVKTLDIGLPQLAMHSVRELAGVKDSYYLYQLLVHYYQGE